MSSPALMLPLILVAGIAIIVVAIMVGLPRAQSRRRAATARGRTADATAGSDAGWHFDGGSAGDCGADGGGGCD